MVLFLPQAFAVDPDLFELEVAVGTASERSRQHLIDFSHRWALCANRLSLAPHLLSLQVHLPPW